MEIEVVGRGSEWVVRDENCNLVHGLVHGDDDEGYARQPKRDEI